ncbi:MAG: hypothetical protein K0Q92_3797 [Steroidobacteraceae bacterium]|jgi:hypothetical protein|nr:hypothetical protein [Steroidobacteraceae bacterium]
MKTGRKSFLEILDDSVRWTGMPARVAQQLSGDPDRRHQPLRWRPIGPIMYACVLFVIALVWPPLLGGIDPGALIGVLVAFWGALFAMVPGIHANGPLGNSALEDDERQAALRKESILFCVGFLAVLNVLGQPLLMIVSHWQDWSMARAATVMTTALMLNIALWICLPTLHASWTLRQLPKE